MTQVWTVSPAHPDARVLAEAASWLSGGGLLVFPTDTLYGLACDVRRSDAVDAVFDAKGRGAQAALPLVAASLDQVIALTGDLSPAEHRVAAAAWPGPLSLIRPAPAWMPAAVHGGHGTVAVRVPAHPVAAGVAEALGSCIAATSANRSGSPAVDCVAHLDAIAQDPRVAILDAGPTAGGAPSTIVDLRSGVPVCVRQGAVPWSRVLEWLYA